MQGGKPLADRKRPVVAFYKVEEIFNIAEQREALDLAGDSSESGSEDEEDGLSEDSADIEGCVTPSRCPDFELDRSTNLGFIFLQGMLSGKGLAGFPDYELSVQPRTAVDVDDEAPTEGDWKIHRIDLE